MRKARKNSRMLKCCLAVFITAAALLCMPGCILPSPGILTAEAADLSDDIFPDLQWKLEFADAKTGVVQSVCVTDNYIITIDNVADDASRNDIVSAYYKNTTDENGDPVKQYSLAKRVCNFNWEHGNCMTYNPTTGLIYVSLYTNTEGDNAGCVYEMDPRTLSYVGKQQIGDGSYNILGLGYKSDTNQYVMQTDAAGGFSMKLLDADFRIIDDFGPQDPKPGSNFQGLMADGDYAVNLPVTVRKNLGEWMDVFSVSRRSVIYSGQMNIDLYGADVTEGEGFARLDQDTLLLIMNVVTKDGANMVRFYTASLSKNESTKEAADSGSSSLSSDSLSENSAAEPAEADSSQSGLSDAASASGREMALPSSGENAADGTASIVSEAPAVRVLNTFLTNAEKLVRALVTGNRKALRRFGRRTAARWKKLVRRVRAFRPPGWLPYAILFAVLLAAGPGMLLYMIHLKRARRRLRKRTKELREEIRKKMEEDAK